MNMQYIPIDKNTIKYWMKDFLGHEEHRPVFITNDGINITCSCGALLVVNNFISVEKNK